MRTLTEESTQFVRTYYLDKVISQGRFKGEGNTYAQTTDEATALLDAGNPHTRINRCDRIMRHDFERDMWTEQYRINYTYDTETCTWKFSGLWEGLNKVR